MPLRRLDQALTDKDLEDIGSVTARDVWVAMRDEYPHITLSQRTAVINRLHNMKHSASALEIRASELIPTYSKKGLEINIPSRGVTGKIEDVGWVNGSLVIVINSELNILSPSATVRVWPEEETENGVPPRIEERQTVDFIYNHWSKYVGRKARLLHETGWQEGVLTDMKRGVLRGPFDNSYKIVVLDGRMYEALDDTIMDIIDQKNTRCELRDRIGKQCIIVNALTHDHVHIFER